MPATAALRPVGKAGCAGGEAFAQGGACGPAPHQLPAGAPSATFNLSASRLCSSGVIQDTRR